MLPILFSVSVTFYPYTSTNFCPKHCTLFLSLFSPPVPLTCQWLTHASSILSGTESLRNMWKIHYLLTKWWEHPTAQVHLPEEKWICLSSSAEGEEHIITGSTGTLKTCLESVKSFALLALSRYAKSAHSAPRLCSPSGSSPQLTASVSFQQLLTASLLPRDCSLLESNSVLLHLKGPPGYSKKLLIALSGLSKSCMFYTSTFMRTPLNSIAEELAEKSLKITSLQS